MKILFIASIATKNNHFDGERNKSKDVLNALQGHYKIKSVNLSSKLFRIPSILLFILYVLFWHPKKVFICKSPKGASLIANILKRIGYDLNDVIIYSIGLGLEGQFDKLTKDKEIFSKVGILIVENSAAADSFKKHGCNNIRCFPCIKRIYELPKDIPFKEKQTLKSIFFARLVEDKGVFLAVDAIIEVNKDLAIPKFTLDIAGKPANKEIENRLQGIAKKYSFINYLGTTFTITGKDSYLRLQKYDLNIFPSWYNHECAPGSVVDMFIAGVPTLSSQFSGSKVMLSEKCAYFAKTKSLQDNIEKLEYIYKNQRELYEKRSACRDRKYEYSYDSFIKFFDGIIKDRK